MTKKCKKFLAMLLALALCMGSTVTAFAAERESNPYTVKGKYVQELVDLNGQELANLSSEQARKLFEQAFSVSASAYTNKEIRTGLEGLAISLKFQLKMDKVKERDPSNAGSTTGSVDYSGDVGVAWVRDTTNGHSPLTLGEILSGTYTPEVDYLTWDSAASVLAASASYSEFKSILELVGTGASGSALGEAVCAALDISGAPAVIASGAVSLAVSFGWDWLQKINRASMLDCFNDMGHHDYMQVKYIVSGNTITRSYSTVYKGKSISNPFSGKYGNWFKDEYGYLYSL